MNSIVKERRLRAGAFCISEKEDLTIEKYPDLEPTLELEREGDTRPDDMADEILTLNENGKPIVVEVEDDPEPEETEEPADVEYD